MTTNALASRLRRSGCHGVPIAVLVFLLLAAATGVAFIAAEPEFVEAETAVIHTGGPGSTGPLLGKDHESSADRAAAPGDMGSPSTAEPLRASRDNRWGSEERAGVPIASRREVHAYLLGTATQLHAPAAVTSPPPRCLPCAATRATADQRGDHEAAAADVLASE